MKKSTRTLLHVIGAASLVAGIYLAVSGSDFIEYASGIFVGVVLIGSAYYDYRWDDGEDEGTP